jgi:hypothetical protein
MIRSCGCRIIAPDGAKLGSRSNITRLALGMLPVPAGFASRTNPATRRRRRWRVSGRRFRYKMQTGSHLTPRSARIHQLPIEIARSGLVDHDGAAHCGVGHVIMPAGRVADLISAARRILTDARLGCSSTRGGPSTLAKLFMATARRIDICWSSRIL